MGNVRKLAEIIMRCVKRSPDVENLGAITFYAIEFQGNILPSTISLYTWMTTDERSASWWVANAERAKLVQLKVTKV